MLLELSVSDWFIKNKRELPWRENPTPYRVWISEVMLQQTVAQVVVDYFERWMRRFPTIRDLAQAKEDEVLKAWEGLGYYSRARNLHKGAQVVWERFGGELPDDEALLSQIPGIGPYTVGAILSFAFKQRAAAVDGNVLRVLARYFGIEEEIDAPRVQKRMRELCLLHLPQEDPHSAMEGLIELGALVCKKTPRCFECPLISACRAFNENKTALLPKRKARVKTTHLYRFVPLFIRDDTILLKRGEEGKVMAGLWEFPFFEMADPEDPLSFAETTLKRFEVKAEFVKEMASVSHSFTNFRAHLYPSLWLFHEGNLEGEWVRLKDLESLPFSSGHRRLLNDLARVLTELYRT